MLLMEQWWMDETEAADMLDEALRLVAEYAESLLPGVKLKADISRWKDDNVGWIDVAEIYGEAGEPW